MTKSRAKVIPETIIMCCGSCGDYDKLSPGMGWKCRKTGERLFSLGELGYDCPLADAVVDAKVTNHD